MSSSAGIGPGPAGRGRWPLALLLALALAGPGCRREPTPGPDVAARIAGEDLPYAVFEVYVRSTIDEAAPSLGSDVLSRLFDQFLDEQVTIRLAREQGLAAETPRAAAESLLATLVGSAPAAAEIEAWYRAHPERFSRPERVRLRQLLVDDREVAERARREIAAGAEFTAVAGALAEGEHTRFQGEQGVVARDDLPPALATAIFALAPGEVSAVVAADYGFHVFQVVERWPADTVPLAAAASEIAAQLGRERGAAALLALVAEARSRYDARVYARNVPFNYRGVYPLAQGG